MNILINGGTRGIGKAVVNYLAQNINNRILVTGRNKQILKNLESAYTNVKALPVDLSIFDSQQEIFTKTLSDQFTHIDILINMAGMLVSKEFVNNGQFRGQTNDGN